MQLKMIRWNNCPGVIDGKSCPYKARFANDKNQSTCGMHIHTQNIKSPNRPIKPLVSWVMSMCDICTLSEEVKYFECNKHKYCKRCLVEISKYDMCPICLSIHDH
jgi:hypothetical protein